MQHWRIEEGDRVIAGSEDDRPVMEAAVEQLDGRAYVGGRICGETGDSVLEFSGGCILRAFSMTQDDLEATDGWSLRQGEGKFVQLRASGK